MVVGMKIEPKKVNHNLNHNHPSLNNPSFQNKYYSMRSVKKNLAPC
jgi:hypothetical protein